MEATERITLDVPVDAIAQKAIEKMDAGSSVFEDSARFSVEKVSGAPSSLRGFVPWGNDNQRPYHIVKLRRRDEVMSSNMFTKVLMGFGLGIVHTKPDGSPTENEEVLRFFKYNRPTRYLLEQQTDLKHFFFSISLLVLSNDGTKIVNLRHLDASFTRLESANPRTGVIEHIYYGNFQDGNKPKYDDLDVYPLLDVTDPLGDLERRMGRLENESGKKGKMSTDRKFAMMNFVPVPGNQYYPFPYSWAVFKSGWYDIKQLIAEGKKIKFKNGLVIKYQVEIDPRYWDSIFELENIKDPAKKKERKLKEQEDIKTFLTGMHNAGKILFSGKYVGLDGKENSYISIKVINSEKEGGDWLDDTEEASNMECYADIMPPQMIGAVPGKSKATFSGTDKRETFTMMQALEVPTRQLILEPYYVITNYNGWEKDVKIDIPFMQLTTLDKGTDAVPVQQQPVQ